MYFFYIVLISSNTFETFDKQINRICVDINIIWQIYRKSSIRSPWYCCALRYWPFIFTIGIVYNNKHEKGLLYLHINQSHVSLSFLIKWTWTNVLHFKTLFFFIFIGSFGKHFYHTNFDGNVARIHQSGFWFSVKSQCFLVPNLLN